MSTPQLPMPPQGPGRPGYPLQPVPPYPPAHAMVAPKNPLLHAVVSFFFPGVGSMMAGRVLAGLGFLLGLWIATPIAAVVIWSVGIGVAVNGSESTGEASMGTAIILFVALLIAAFIAWIVSIWHAHHAATEWNRQHGVVS